MGARFLQYTEPAARGHFIEFRNVSKAFDDHLVLDDVSFFVDHGETCVIMGRSGVGKSVTLKHILGFLRPDSGRVLVCGEVSTHSSERKMLSVGIIFVHQARLGYFGSWAGFVAAPEPYPRNFLRQDELIPELDVTS